MPPLGGPTWGTISYDPELGLIYFGVGQPTPWASTPRRGNGDALYTNSVIALDIKTGKMKWHFQVVPLTTGIWIRLTRARWSIYRSME